MFYVLVTTKPHYMGGKIATSYDVFKNEDDRKNYIESLDVSIDNLEVWDPIDKECLLDEQALHPGLFHYHSKPITCGYDTITSKNQRG